MGIFISAFLLLFVSLVSSCHANLIKENLDNTVQADWYEAVMKAQELWWVVYKAQDAIKTTAGFSNTEIGLVITEKVNAIRNLALDPIQDLQAFILSELLTPELLEQQVLLVESGVHAMEREIAYYVARLPEDGQSSIFEIYLVTFTDIGRVKSEINELISLSILDK